MRTRGSGSSVSLSQLKVALARALSSRPNGNVARTRFRALGSKLERSHLSEVSPSLDKVRAQAARLKWSTSVRIAVDDMATLMAHSDFAIGAAGATSWERCCLGLPTALLILAENQKFAAARLEAAHAVFVLEAGPSLARDIQQIAELIQGDTSRMTDLTEHSKMITDGSGCQRVLLTLQSMSCVREK